MTDEFQLPAGITVNDVIQDYTSEFSRYNRNVSCSSSHIKCTKLKKFIKYLIDKNLTNNINIIYQLKTHLLPQLCNYYNSKACWDNNEPYNRVLMKTIFTMTQFSFQIYFDRMPAYITNIFKESFIENLANKADFDIDSLISYSNYFDDTFINDIYNVIDQKNLDKFIEKILCKYDYDNSELFNGFIEKFIETKNIPTRRHLLLALQTNCYDIIRSFISAGAKLDKDIFDDLLKLKCANSPSNYQGCIDKNIAELLIDNKFDRAIHPVIKTKITSVLEGVELRRIQLCVGIEPADHGVVVLKYARPVVRTTDHVAAGDRQVVGEKERDGHARRCFVDRTEW